MIEKINLKISPSDMLPLRQSHDYELTNAIIFHPDN